MRLSKEVCRWCLERLGRCWSVELEERMWEAGFIWCPETPLRFEGAMPTSVLPFHCRYRAEHIVSEEHDG